MATAVRDKSYSSSIIVALPVSSARLLHVFLSKPQLHAAKASCEHGIACRSGAASLSHFHFPIGSGGSIGLCRVQNVYFGSTRPQKAQTIAGFTAIVSLGMYRLFS
jgi:hypothetical protein